MRVLLLGATGSIGSAVLEELTAHGHAMTALARSDQSAAKLDGKVAAVLRGDLRRPAEWAPAVLNADAVVHAAGTFTDDEGIVDRGVVDALIAAGANASRPIRFIYTGGCWLYGQTGDDVATEETPFDRSHAFAWVIDNANAVVRAPCFECITLHPAMVYHRDGGVLSRFIESAQNNGRIEVWGSTQPRWPVVHTEDVASAYRLALEKGVAGETYNVAAEDGIWVSDIVQAIAHRFGLQSAPLVRTVRDVVDTKGIYSMMVHLRLDSGTASTL